MARKKKKQESGAKVLIVIRKDKLDYSLNIRFPDKKKKKGRLIYILAKCHQEHGLSVRYGLRSLELQCGACRNDMLTIMVSDQPPLLHCTAHPNDGVRLSYDGTHLKTECWTCKLALNSITPQE